jgi:hypothetical protein
VNLNKHGVDMSQPMELVLRDFPDGLPPETLVDLRSDSFRDALIDALHNDDFNCCTAHDDIVADLPHIADVAIERLLR